MKVSGKLSRFQPNWYSLAAIFLSMVILATVSVLISVHYSDQQAVRVQRYSDDQNRKWCDIVTTLDSAYRANPPTTTTGKKLAADMHALRERIGCPD